MSESAGEMPFLDHLEELRSRLIKSLAVVVVAVGFGIWAVLRLGVLKLLITPIAPYLPDGKLSVLAVTEQFTVTLKLGAIVGLVIASPVLIYQLWAFLSPALYERERKAMMPALFVGLLLFLTGSFLAWEFVLPRALPILLGFQADSFNNMITFEFYFSFVMAVLIGLGVSFELPLIMIVLAAVGIMDGPRYNKYRRYAILLAFIAGALLSPGGDALLMAVFTAPLLLLYEIGVAGSYFVARKRKANTIGSIIIFLLLAGGATSSLSAQDGPPGGVRIPIGAKAGQRQQGDTGQRNAKPAQQVDTATAKRLGLPTRPSRSFPAPDSTMQALLNRPGFAVTRFIGDSAILYAADSRIILAGDAATERDGSRMEAQDIVFDDERCELIATGDPQMFEGQKIAIGRRLRFDTCNNRGVFEEAFTTFDQLGSNWFVRGNLAVDSSASRMFASSGEFTSCDLPMPHYEFRAGKVKWISESYMVARPAVLYVRDVPIIWLPFLFQDTKPGRRSGILIPQFGFNDIVRPTRSYNRQITNIGYYWAPNDYLDTRVWFDWYSSRFVQYAVDLRYRWLDRFIQGGVSLSRQVEVGGSKGMSLSWDHSQQFNASTSLRFNVDYTTNSRVLAGNSVDPLLSTRQIVSSATFNKDFRWGKLTLGGTRRQNVSDGSGTMTLPSLTISPKPIAFGRSITWSPLLSATNTTQFSQTLPDQFLLNGSGVDSISATGSSRRSQFDFRTPVRIGRFNWQNTVTYADERTTSRIVTTSKVPDLSTADPDDSISVQRTTGGDFRTALDWSTGVNLPQLFTGSWKLTPKVQVQNVTGGPFMIRNSKTNGEWVQQSKRLKFGLTMAPDFFGFLNTGVGPFAKFRHQITPAVDFSWEPEAEVPLEYALATGQSTAAPPKLSLGVRLTQNFQGKPHPEPGDTTTDPRGVTPVTLLSISTSEFRYDFEQAKLPGRTGWINQTMTNRLSTDLIQGFSLGLTHDLWDGKVGTDTAKFSLFLSQVDANFSVTGNTLKSVLSIFGLGQAPTDGLRAPEDTTSNSLEAAALDPSKRLSPLGPMAGYGMPRVGKDFRAGISYSLSRSRPGASGSTQVPISPDLDGDPFGGLPILAPVTSGNRSSLGLNISFSPTTFWSVQWNTQYNITDGRFEMHTLRLTRNLHDWEASFNVQKSPNGNFQLFFNIYLRALPDIKFDYNQTTIER